jgi:transposase InsO family protein
VVPEFKSSGKEQKEKKDHAATKAKIALEGCGNRQPWRITPSVMSGIFWRFLYLVAVMDRASRAVLPWRLSKTIDASFCVEAPEKALARFGKSKIFNTDPRFAIHQRDFYRRA